MKTITYDIPNISCNHCVHTIESEVSELNGVQQVHADVASKRATIIFQNPASEEKIKSLLSEIGYPVSSEHSPA